MTIVALFALATTMVGTALGLGLVLLRVSGAALPPEQLGSVLFPPLGAVPFAVVGTVLVLRRSKNVIGRLMLLVGTMMGLAFATDAYAKLDMTEAASLPGADLAAWFSDTTWIVTITIVLPRLLLLFPDGQLPSPRWRFVTVVQAALAAAIMLVSLTPGPLPDYPYDNPLGIDAMAGARTLLEANMNLVFAMMFVVLVAACLSLVARFRRSSGVERKQLEWIAWIVLVAALTETLGLMLRPWLPNIGVVATGIVIVAFSLLPISIGIAVLRYRLYEIDRLISRTLGWAIVTGILVAIFAGAVISLQALLAGITQGETLAVAASTLVAFALFQPLRWRIQLAVDRRFDRARYDGQRTVEAFAEELRDRIDLRAIELGALATVDRTVRPTHVALWLRGRFDG